MPEAVGNEKIAFCLKKGVFYWASKPAISVEKGLFCRLKSAKSGGVKFGYECDIQGCWQWNCQSQIQYGTRTRLLLCCRWPSSYWCLASKGCSGCHKVRFFSCIFFLISCFFIFFIFLSMSGWRHWKRSTRCRWHMCNLMCQWTFKAISMTLVQSYV